MSRINEVVDTKGKPINQTTIYRALKILAKRGTGDEEACAIAKSIETENADIFPYGYNCIGKKEQMMISKMLGYNYTLLVVRQK